MFHTKIVALLTGLALCLCTASTILAIQAGTIESHTYLSGKSVYKWNVTPLSEILKASSAIFLCAAGIMQLARGGWRKLGLVGQAGLALVGFSAVGWLVFDSLPNLELTQVLLDNTSPVVWVICLLVFAGMDDRVWEYLSFLFPLLAAVGVGFCVAASFQYQGMDFLHFSPITGYFMIAFWASLFTLFQPRARLASRTIGLLFLTLCLLLAIITQSRSWLIQTALALTVGVAMGLRSRVHWTTLTMLGVILLAGGGSLLVGLGGALDSESALSSFLDRLLDDTRSDQYIDFFAQVSPMDLLLGKGTQATYVFANNLYDYEFIDNLYLYICFRFGAYTLLGYLLLTLVPGLRALFSRNSIETKIALFPMVSWMLALGGISIYTIVGLNLPSMLLAMLAGHFSSLLAASKVAVPLPDDCAPLTETAEDNSTNMPLSPGKT